MDGEHTPNEGQSRTKVWIEARRVLDAPRTTLAERFISCLEKHRDVFPDLPEGEISVTISDQEWIRRPYLRHGEAVGCFVIEKGSDRVDHWEVRIAYGPNYEDEADLLAWLETVPFGLLYLQEFCRRFGGRTPARVDAQELFSQWVMQSKPARDAVEAESRRLVVEVTADWGDWWDDALRDGVQKFRRPRRPRGEASQSVEKTTPTAEPKQTSIPTDDRRRVPYTP